MQYSQAKLLLVSLYLFLDEPKRVAQTNGHQNVHCSKFRELAILKTIRFDTPLIAAKETSKQVPKLTGTTMPSA